MTEPSRPEFPPEPVPVAEPAVDSGSPAPASPRRHGLTTFSIAGRHAPALFLVGWLATLLGAGFVSIAMFGAAGLAGATLWLVGLFALAVGLVLLGGSQTVERRVAGDAYAGPAPIIVFLAVLAISRLTGYAVGLPLSAIGASIPAPVGDLIAGVLQALVFVGVVRLMVVGAGALGWHQMGLRRGTAEAVRGLLGGAAFAGPVILVAAILAVVAVQLVGIAPQSPLPPTGTAFGLALHLMAGAVIAPVAEELLFRGFALTAWLRTGSARRAIVLSSLFFVLGHVLFVGGSSFRESASLAFVGGIVRIPVALTLGWLYVRTGSLWGPIGLHAAYNAILIVLGEVGAAH